MQTFSISIPSFFSWKAHLYYLENSDQETLYRIDHGKIKKALRIEGSIGFVSLEKQDQSILVSWEGEVVKEEYLRAYVNDWLDLETDLTEFYSLYANDEIIGPLLKKHEGLRILGVPDLFEAGTWAIIGQQINLAFAYKVKRKFIFEFGECVEKDGHQYWLFPSPEKILITLDADMAAIQLSRQKIKYIKELAYQILTHQVQKEELRKGSLEEATKQLTRIKGVGMWTAHYILMRSLHYKDSFPAADAGIHQALRKIKEDPSIKEAATREIFQPYLPWAAYATYYLWRSLSY